VDIAVLRRDQTPLRDHLSGWDLRVAIARGGLIPWPSDLRLDPPLHEVWVRPAGSEEWICEFLMNDASDTDWIYRRDARVTYPLDDLLASRRADLPVLPPEIVLLYKSKDPTHGDVIDFRATYPQLTARAREWLSSALTLTEPRGHPWT
jgi:hypothetical protein